MVRTVQVDTEALRKASGKGADTRDAVDSWTSRVVKVLARLPAACGNDQYANDFFEGRDGQPGAWEAMEATRDGAEVMSRYCGDLYRAQADQAEAFDAAEETSSRNFGG